MENFETWLSFVVLATFFVGLVAGGLYTWKRGEDSYKTEHPNELWSTVTIFCGFFLVFVTPPLFEVSVRLFGAG